MRKFSVPDSLALSLRWCHGEQLTGNQKSIIVFRDCVPIRRLHGRHHGEKTQKLEATSLELSDEALPCN
jgi:hypothetical protein